MADLVQRDFCARDMITSMPNGFYVFLIKVDEHVVARVADQVEEALTQWEGMQTKTSYPEDREHIGELLRLVKRNTQRLAQGDVNTSF